MYICTYVHECCQCLKCKGFKPNVLVFVAAMYQIMLRLVAKVPGDPPTLNEVRERISSAVLLIHVPHFDGIVGQKEVQLVP